VHVPSSDREGAHLWQIELALPRLAHLADHKVNGAVVLPMATWVDLAVTAAREAYGQEVAAVRDLTIQSALVLQGELPVLLHVSLTTAYDAGDECVRFEIRSRETSVSPAAWIRHVRGVLRFASLSPGPSGTVAIPELLASLSEHTTGDDHYHALADRGLEYGPAFRAVEEVWHGQTMAIARLAPAAGLPGYSERCTVAPAALDGALQALATAAAGASQGAAVPVGARSVGLFGRLENARWAVARIRSAPSATQPPSGDIHILSEDGHVLAEIEGLRIQSLDGDDAARPRFADWLLRLDWRRAPAPASPAADARPLGFWLLVEDDGPTGERIAEAMRRAGARCERVGVSGRARNADRPAKGLGSLSPEGLVAALQPAAAAAGSPLSGVIHAAGVDDERELPASTADLASRVEASCRSALAIAQALMGSALRDPPRLVLVTAGAQPIEGTGRLRLAQAPVVGLARAVANECPELRCVHVDLSGAEDSRELGNLSMLLAADTREGQLALRGDSIWVPRLVRAYEALQPQATARRTVVGKDSAFQLTIDRPGVLDRLALHERSRRPPERGEVEIQIEAAALNFADVMKAMGLYGGDTTLGGECAGRIVRVGEGVTAWRVGDEVVALAPGCFASFVTLPEPFVFRRPTALDAPQAAAVPVAFLTCHYALNYLARLAPGERVLIHSATGGVGLAAIQLARRIGAEIYATAGTEAKRKVLSDLGIRSVADSRSLQFAEDVLTATKGEGVDVVLNSLAGHAIQRGLEILRPFGRFLEVGKRDILSNSGLGMEAFLRNVSFHAVNVDLAARERPALMGRLLKEILDDYEERKLEPLPVQTFPISQAVDAFHEMAHARHVGKLVLLTDDEGARVVRIAHQGVELSADATYLITGGLGALGLEVASWMVRRKARTLVLVGRRGEDDASEQARAAIGSLRACGARVEVISADVADEKAMASALERIERELPPLRGVVHAAGSLDDGLISDQTWPRFVTVFASKVLGAWNLHTLTERLPLDFFVLFSSAASLVGSPGQANYSSANAFLDALAHERRSRGLPALSVNWGPWGEAGLATGPDRAGRLAFRGFGSIDSNNGVAALDWLMARSEPQVGVLPMDLRVWRQFYPHAAELPLLGELVAADGAPQPKGDETPMRKALTAAAPGPERRAALEEHLQDQIAQVLRRPKSRIDRFTPLRALGFDSLMALELRNRLEASLRVRLSATMAWNYPTIAELAPHIAGKMGLQLEPGSVVATDAAITDDVAALAIVLQKAKAMESTTRTDTSSHD
jgi:NADPH:quinone reductase-like Zn-dependent oxidoreductase/NAD(P)-dependent dehydrogenase (short-subunit alcohol dehydrogenase family)/acyl carrier protein